MTVKNCLKTSWYVWKQLLDVAPRHSVPTMQKSISIVFTLFSFPSHIHLVYNFSIPLLLSSILNILDALARFISVSKHYFSDVSNSIQLFFVDCAPLAVVWARKREKRVIEFIRKDVGELQVGQETISCRCVCCFLLRCSVM